MGIERFFSTLLNINNLWKENKYPYQKMTPEIFLLDFNSIVHITSTKVLNSKIDPNEIENEILKNIREYLIHLLTDVINYQKLDVLYLAVDGVPSFGKMREQIKRRYMGEIISQQSKSNSLWSKANITPGTKFMTKLNNYLNNLISELKSQFNIKNIILSDSNEDDEGEIKIINFLRTLTTDKRDILIYSPDSDMVLLNLLIKEKYQVSLLRFNQQSSDLTSLNNQLNIYEIMTMKNFRKYLFDYVKKTTKNNSLEERKIIRDIILVFNCFGNDFLPKINSINLKHDFLYLINLYCLTLITTQSYLIENGKINSNNLKEFFKLCEKSEYENLKLQYNRLKYHNFDRALINNYFYDISSLEEKITNIKLKFLTRYFNLAKIRCENPTILNLSNCLNLKDFYKFYHSQYDSKYDYNKNSLKIEPDVNEDLNNDIYYNMKKDIIDIIEEDKNSYQYFYYWSLRLLDLEELYNKLYRGGLRSHSYATLKDKTTQDMIKKYGYLFYYFADPTNILDDLISYQFLNNNLPTLNHQIFIRNFTYQRMSLKLRNYNSQSKYHQDKMINMNENEKKLYKIQNYLDEYKDIFKPELFSSISSYPEMIQEYNNRFFKDDIKNVVKNYLDGINWVFNNYLKNKVDEFWYYPYSHAPLLKDLIDNFVIENNLVEKKHNLKPFQQFIMVSPYKESNKNLIDHPEDDIDKIYNDITSSNLIPREVKLENIDCSGSIFFNKCHPEIIDKIDFNKLHNYFKN